MAYSLWWSKVQYTLNRGGPWSTNLHSGASSFKERIIRTRQSIIHFSFFHVPNSDRGSALHRCMHCSLRKGLRCMHSLFVRRRPGHASLFDRGLVSPVRCRTVYGHELLLSCHTGTGRTAVWPSIPREQFRRLPADVLVIDIPVLRTSTLL